jgi:outer membrane lipoprotein SlyB
LSDQCLIAEFDSRKTAQLGLEVLEKAGFTTEQVSVVRQTVDGDAIANSDAIEGLEVSTKTPAATFGIGALLAGGALTPIAASTLIGPFFLAGPLVAAGLGAAAGGMLGSASPWGVTETENASYEERVRAGAVLIVVNGGLGDINEAQASLRTVGPNSLVRFGHEE